MLSRKPLWKSNRFFCYLQRHTLCWWLLQAGNRWLLDPYWRLTCRPYTITKHKRVSIKIHPQTVHMQRKWWGCNTLLKKATRSERRTCYVHKVCFIFDFATYEVVTSPLAKCSRLRRVISAFPIYDTNYDSLMTIFLWLWRLISASGNHILRFTTARNKIIFSPSSTQI